MGKIKWASETRSIDDLIPADYNPRQANDKQTKDLERSLDRFDLASPIVINKDGKVIGGHFRLRILKDKGIDMVDVRVPDRQLSEEEERELNLRLNKNTGEWDWGNLANFDEMDLLNVGFEAEELKVQFGIAEAAAVDEIVDPSRLSVLVVEAPGAPRLKSRQVFYCDSIKDFEELKSHFSTGKEGYLDVEKLKKAAGI